MPRLRRLARLAGTLLVTLLLMVAAVAVVAQTAWFKDWLRLKLVSQLAGVLDAELRVGHLGGTLWTGVTLDNVELRNRDGQVLQADRINVRYDPFTLAQRRWIVDRVVIERASIRIVETASGWNVLHLTRPRTSGGAPPTVVIRSIQLTHSTVTIDSATAAPRTLTHVHLDSSLRASGGAVSLDIAMLRLFDKETGLSLNDLTGTTSDNFRIFDVRFAANSQAMTIGGTARGRMDGGARVLEADVDTSHLDLAQFLHQPKFTSDITGHAKATASLPAGNQPWQIAFRFSGPGSRALGYAADRIDATGRITSTAVVFDSNVSAYGTQASVHGNWRWAAHGRPFAFDARGTFAALDVRRLPPTLKLPPLDTRIAGRFDTSVTGGRWTAHATLSGGVVEGATLGPNTEAAIESADGVTMYAAVGTASRVDVDRFGRVLRIAAMSAPRFVSDLSGEFFVVGRESRDAPRLVTGGAILTDSTISGTRVAHLNTFTTLADRRLVVSARGKFDRLNETTLDLPPDSFVAAGDVDGWFAIKDIDLPITEQNLEISGRADLGPSTLRGVALESAVVQGRLLEGLLTLDTLDARAPEATVQASGVLGLQEPASGAGMTLRADIKDRAFIERLLQRPVFAAGSVDAVVTGTVASPSASGSLSLQQVAYGDDATALTAKATFVVDWPDRVVDRMTWKVDGDAVFVTLGGTEIQRIAAKVNGGPREMAIDVVAEQKSRTIGIDGQLVIRPEADELLLRRLALTAEASEWTLPAGRQGSVQYVANRVEARDLTLVHGTQEISVKGGFDVGAGTPAIGGAPLQFALTNVDVAEVNRILLGTRQLTGLINGLVTISGNRAAPIVEGDLTIAKGAVEGVPYESVKARGSYADGVATVDAVLEQGPGASLRASGTIPVSTSADAGRSMDLRVTGGPVNLGLVQAFTSELDKVAGDASIDLRVTGSIGNPMLAGTATVAKGTFTVLGTGVTYQGVEAALDFADGRMTVRTLRLADASGDELTATGDLDIRRGVSSRALDIKVRANSVSVLANQFGNAAMNADIRVSGELGALVVRGTATLDSGRIEVAHLLNQTSARPYATTAQAAPGAEQPVARVQTPWETADVNVQLHLPDNLVLRGRNLRVSGSGFGLGDMNIVTGGSFDLTKAPGADVGVRGTLEVVSGSYTFQGRRFEIERGSDVRFPGGGSLTDPIINVNATREIGGVTAEVRLRGSARSPELALSSRPALDESDILSMIVFNQPVSALGSAEQVNLGQRAAAMAAGAIASPLADSIGRALNLDVFEIQAPTDDAAGSVVIGSQLGSRILVGLRQQFGHSETSMVTLEYRVSKLLRFVTSVASGTLQAHATRRTDRGGVDLIFVIRY